MEAVVGDARDLPAVDASADVVPMFGPLYHLQDRADRVSACREAARVVGPVWMARSGLADPLEDPALVLDLLREVEDEPSLLGASSHLLTVAVRDAPVG
ncbi:class I SAM-dependent methyltransferase [Actinoplanes sp. M2I2]|uniref:class I SAM-dependent methyltransferase n=1 Tax=Actinoplanes sp. M2I2 TaxID=1734444 RepID=UPI00202239C7|nr:class I SAM-dependent methyltransferase [Actinoplanes sp. M2I2]